MARTRYQVSAVAIPLRALPAAALRAVLREGYRAHDFRADLLSGVIVGVVALPLAMALAIAVGAPPQHGLYTSIVAGFVVAALGGSRFQISGPTAAFIVILAPIQAKFGLEGLLLSGLLGGLILIVLGLCRFGKLIEFIPHPVTTGFTSGIAVVIATLQLKDLLGLKLAGTPDGFIDRLTMMFDARASFSGWELAMGLATLAGLLGIPRLTRRVPAPLLVLPLAAIMAALLHRMVPGFTVATIESRFHGIPQQPPTPLLPWLASGPHGPPLALNWHLVRALLPDAFAVAMLGAIESLLSAVVADGMALTKHDPDAELLALGVGNVIAPFLGGIPATGAIARTATNIRSGARSPISGMVHAATVLAAVLVLAPLLGYLPMSALAALLLLVAWNMSEARHFAHTLRVAPKSDVAVLLACFGLTVAFDMVIGVTTGLMLAALLFMRRMAEVTEVRFTSGQHPDLPGPSPQGVAVYEISGPLFFGAAQKAMAALNIIGDGSRAVILLMDGVQAMDATGLVALESALVQLKKNKCLAVLSNVRAQPLGVLRRAGLDRREGVVICADGAAALAAASRYVAVGHVPYPTGVVVEA